MSHLAPIYAIWDGNAAAMAADIGEPDVKVRQWRNRGNIPSAYWPAIIAAAGARGHTLNWKQFISPADSDQRTHDTTSAIDDEPRVILCSVCELRLDDQTRRNCNFRDCPHSESLAA